MRCSPGLVLLLVEVVSDGTQYLPLYNDRGEEIVKFLGEFTRHRDRVLGAQFPNGVAGTHVVHLPRVGGYLLTVVLGRWTILPHHSVRRMNQYCFKPRTLWNTVDRLPSICSSVCDARSMNSPTGIAPCLVLLSMLHMPGASSRISFCQSRKNTYWSSLRNRPSL